MSYAIRKTATCDNSLVRKFLNIDFVILTKGQIITKAEGLAMGIPNELLKKDETFLTWDFSTAVKQIMERKEEIISGVTDELIDRMKELGYVTFPIILSNEQKEPFWANSAPFEQAKSIASNCLAEVIRLFPLLKNDPKINVSVYNSY